MKIQCPECSQRFDVTEDLLGKTVECGSCDARFDVTTDELVAEKKKFYPGEKRGSHLDRFGRNTPSSAAVSFQEAQYLNDVDPMLMGPPLPRKTVSVVFGVLLMIVIVVVFLLAGGREGTMRDMETLNRFILCGFTALVGSTLVIYGSANNRVKGVILALVCSSILMSMPILFPANPTKASVLDIQDVTTIGKKAAKSDAEKALKIRQDYLLEIGYEPVDSVLRKHRKESVVGIFVRDASPQLRRSIGAYIYDATGKKSRETTYDNVDNDMTGLILFTDQVMSIDEIAALCTKFGRVEKISKDLRIIDVIVENSRIAKLDQYTVLDSDSIDYEAQNLEALNSIDPKVKMDAVRRLASSKPRARRDDITQKLIQLLSSSNAEQQLEIIRALKTWALPGSGVEKPVFEAVKSIHKQGKVNQDAIDFLLKFEVVEAGDLLLELWNGDPVRSSQTIINLGEGSQVLLLPGLENMDIAHIVSASEILGKSAEKSAIPHIEEVMRGKSGQAKKSLQAAIDEIKRRF